MRGKMNKLVKILLAFSLAIMLSITMMPLGTLFAAETETTSDIDQVTTEATGEQVEKEDEEDTINTEDTTESSNESDESHDTPQGEAKDKKSSKDRNDAAYVIDVSAIATTNSFNQDIALLEGVTVTPDKYMDGDEEKDVLIRVKSATPSNTGSEFDSSQDYNAETSTLNVKNVDSAGHTRAQVTYTIVYEAYVGDTVLATANVDIQFFDDSLIGGLVEEDVAYISKAQVLDTVDGTASFDSQSGPGYDTGDHNKIVRTFDSVTDTVELTNAVYGNSDYAKYEKGYVGFEFVLEGDYEKVEFNKAKMTWLQAKHADYTILKDVEKDGKKYQVMRGTFLWESEDAGQPAIGAASLTIDVSYSVLGMKNGDEIQPDYTFWMVYNDVPDKDKDIEDFTADGYNFVKDYNDECDVHNRVEPVHIKGEKVQVSAAPWYNVNLSTGSADSLQLGYWDLANGNYSPDTETDTSIYGRSFVAGATIQIKRPDGKGLKGCELPNGDDITLSLYFDNWHFKGDDTGHNYNEPESLPILWSYEGNSSGATQQDGRTIPVSKKYAPQAPLNTQPGSFGGCYNGGTWQAVQNGTKVNTGTSGYDVKLDLSYIPHTWSYSNADTFKYYSKDAKSVSEVDTLCFSAGEFWFVQPFYLYDITNDGGNISVTKNGYMPDVVGEGGSFLGTLRDGGLQITSESGQTLADVENNSNQSDKSDDALNLSVVLDKPGTIVTNTGYTEYGEWHFANYNNPLTPGCGENGLDWVMTGGKLTISSYLSHNQGDVPYMGAAYDQLIKFDDRFFDLEKVRNYAKATNRDVMPDLNLMKTDTIRK